MADNDSLGLSLASGVGPCGLQQLHRRGRPRGSIVGGRSRGSGSTTTSISPSSRARWRGQLGRKSLGDWKYLTGARRPLRRSSPVDVPRPEAGDYRPTGTLGWSLARRGHVRLGRSDRSRAIEAARSRTSTAGRGPAGSTWGPYEVALTPPRPADGTLEGPFGRRDQERGDLRRQGAGGRLPLPQPPAARGRAPDLVPRPRLPRPAGSRRGPMRSARSRRITAGSISAGSATRARRIRRAIPPRSACSGSAFDDAGHLLRRPGLVGGHDQRPGLRGRAPARSPGPSAARR